MKTLILADHVVGLCRRAIINFDLIEAAVPHRELPEHVTVVYVGSQHFWLSIPFNQYLHFVVGMLGGTDDLEATIISEDGDRLFVCPTTPPGEKVFHWLRDHDAAKQAGQIRTKPVRYDPENSWRPGSGR